MTQQLKIDKFMQFDFIWMSLVECSQRKRNISRILSHMWNIKELFKGIIKSKVNRKEELKTILQ